MERYSEGGEVAGTKEGLSGPAITLISAVMMIIPGIIYFFLTILVMKGSTDIMFGDDLSADWGTLAAAIVMGAVVIAGALERMAQSDISATKPPWIP